MSAPRVPPVDQSASRCFACGPNEAHGLQLRFHFTSATSIECSVAFDRRFQGFEGIVHGGLIATVLDDAMANIACLQGERAMTAELNTRFLHAVRVDEPLTLHAEQVRRRGKFMECRGELVDARGEIRATATGKFLIAG